MTLYAIIPIVWGVGGVVALGAAVVVGMMVLDSSSSSTNTNGGNVKKEAQTQTQTQDFVKAAKDFWGAMNVIIPYKEAFGPTDGQNDPVSFEPVRQLGATVLKFRDDMQQYGWRYVLSAYRNPTYNEKIGGMKGSYHTKGKAIDFAPLATDREYLWSLARHMMSKGWVVLIYEAGSANGVKGTFVHVNLGQKPKIRWKVGDGFLDHPPSNEPAPTPEDIPAGSKNQWLL